MIGNVNNVPSYTVLHNRSNVLCIRLSGFRVVKRICLMGKVVKGYICRYFKLMEEFIYSILDAWVVDKGITVKVVKLRGIPLQGGVFARCGNVGFDKSYFFEGYLACETLNKKHDVLIINYFAPRHYLTFSIWLIKMRVKIAKIRLILPFNSFQWEIR